MSITLAGLLLFCVVWPFIAKMFWPRTLNWQEVGLNVVIAACGVIFLWEMGKIAQTKDIEIWNGEVLSKASQHVSCSHSYSCNCHKTCDKDGNNCTESCDTCYEHSYDVDWNVFTNIGNFTIDRVDRQGVHEPPRWSQVQRGQPVSLEKYYDNYVQAVEHSLYTRKPGDFPGLPEVPKYPHVYDYHYIDRVFAVGTPLPDKALWNADLADMLRDLGPRKEANAIVLIVKTPDPAYRYKVESAWEGGNKNDVVVFIGVDDAHHILWADVMTWALNKGNEMFQVELRDHLLNLKTLDRANVLREINNGISNSFNRPHMADFAYLKSAIKPPLWAVILCFFVCFGLSFGLTAYFNKHDVRLFK